MFSMGKGGGPEARVKPQQTLTIPEWTWDCSRLQIAAQSLATLFKIQNHVSGVLNGLGIYECFSSSASKKLYSSRAKSLQQITCLRWTKKVCTPNFQFGHLQVSHYNILLQVLIYKLNRVIKSYVDSIPLSKFHCNKIFHNSHIEFLDGGEQTKLAHSLFVVKRLGRVGFLISIVEKEVSHIGFSLSSCKEYSLFDKW